MRAGGLKIFDPKGLFTALLTLFLAFHNSHLVNEVASTSILIDNE